MNPFPAVLPASIKIFQPSWQKSSRLFQPPSVAFLKAFAKLRSIVFKEKDGVKMIIINEQKFL
jgi:hypothetical protein